MLDKRKRNDIFVGLTVDIVLKADQPAGQLTHDVVARVLTNKEKWNYDN